MNYKVIATGSSGNCVVLNDEIMVDCGKIPFKKIKKEVDLDNIKLILYTHEHGDHLHIPNLKKMLEHNPFIKIFCNEEVNNKLEKNGIESIVLTANKTSRLNIKRTKNQYEVRPVNLYHDVKNYGYKLFITDMFGNKTKIFYATDTGYLEGIEAKGYDKYFIETNYDEEFLMDKDYQEEEYNDRFRVISYHLSKQEAQQFFIDNRKEDSELIPLHMSGRNYK